MAAYMTTVDVGAIATYPVSPQVSLAFEPDYWLLRAATGAATGFYASFDGVNDHILILKDDPTLMIPTKAKKLWVRQQTAAACVVRASAMMNT